MNDGQKDSQISLSRPSREMSTVSSSSPKMNLQRNSKCRIAVIGSSQLRIVKIMALLSESLSTHPSAVVAQGHYATLGRYSTTSPCSFTYDTKSAVHGDDAITVEYLPCLATFDSYTNEQGEAVEYLAKVEYHGSDGKAKRGSSLAPFFDATSYVDDGKSSQEDSKLDESIQDHNPSQRVQNLKPKKQQVQHFSGIAGVVIGCGIESTHQVEMIESFVQSLSVGQVIRRETLVSSTHVNQSLRLEDTTIAISNRNLIHPVVLDYLQCNTEFHSITAENEVFRNLPEEDKQLATKLGTLGPGKMVHLIHSVTDCILESYSRNSQSSQLDTTMESKGPIQDLSQDSSITSCPMNIEIFHVQEYAFDKVRFACKLCRTYLFSIEDLEDPPHFKSKHDFHKHLGHAHFSSVSPNASCESLFISVALPWMGNLSDTEGKLACPKCLSKLGHWNWSGAQCSCGTWVTPAIQIPRSRVDTIFPRQATYTNTVESMTLFH